jgi:signal transduction histidine kinase
VLGFATSTATFVGATVYATASLQGVASRLHDVSENAMPSIVELGAMRRALLRVEYALNQSAEGATWDAQQGGAVELGALQDTERKYETLPQFPGEPEVWGRTRAHIDGLPRIARRIGEHIAAGDSDAANAEVTDHLIPSTHVIDDDLAELITLNEEQGRLAAVAADAALSRTRRLSRVLDLVCVAITAGLALAAYLALRGYARATARRTEELEGFAARVAHDIRSPLQPAVLALGAMMRRLRKTDSGEADPLQGSVERGLRGLGHVDDLVGGLLAFAQSGAVPERGASASVQDVVTGVLADLQPEAATHRIELRAEELPSKAMACTSGVLTSIVLNLVTNAIKHFPPDKEPRKILVRGRTEGPMVHVEIEDTGAGVAPAALGRVFDLYVRLDLRRPGLGLGLATVKRLVEAYGGAVGVRSREGAGAMFWFELPCAEPDTAPEAGAYGPFSASSNARRVSRSSNVR